MAHRSEKIIDNRTVLVNLHWLENMTNVTKF